MKSNKGITLVALVITIIVLLILAGVSISLVVGDNGVLTQAKGSSDASKLGQMKEAMGLAIEDCQTAYFNEYTTNASVTVASYITPAKVSEALAKQGYKLYASKSTGGEAQASNEWTESSSQKVYYISDANAFTDYVAVKVQTTTVGAKASYAVALNTDTVNDVQ